MSSEFIAPGGDVVAATAEPTATEPTNVEPTTTPTPDPTVEPGLETTVVSATPSPIAGQPWQTDEWKAQINTLTDDRRSATSLINSKSFDDYVDQVENQAKALGVGKKGIVPGNPEDPTDMGRFYTEMGRPTEPGGYEFSAIPEGMNLAQPMVDSMRQKMFDHGLSKDQAEGIYNDFLEMQGQVDSMVRQHQAGQNFAAREELKKEWGNKYEPNQQFAKALLEKYGADSAATLALLELKDGTFLGDHPDMTRLMVGFGHRMKEGQQVAGEIKPPMGNTPAEAKKKYDAIVGGDMNSAYYNKRDQGHDNAVAQASALLLEMEGVQVIPGVGPDIIG